MMSALAVLWLAAVPCEDSARELQRLEEMSHRAPTELQEYLDTLELRWEGMPLHSPEDDSPGKRAMTAARRIQEVCAQPTSSPAPLSRSEPARLQEILSRPEFAHARQRQGDVLQRLIRAAKAWLEELLETREAQSFATSTRTVVLALGFGVVIFAALRLRHWRRAPKARATVSAPRSETALELDSPGEHLSRARTALGHRPREAIREGLLALLSSLEGKRLARPDRVKTNRELVEELPGRGAPLPLTHEVERLVRWYDRAFYSLEPVPNEDAARFVADVERLHQGLAGDAA